MTRSNGPPGVPELQLSDHGAEAAQGYLNKHADTVEGRVLKAIERAFCLNSKNQIFRFEAAGTQADVLEVLMHDGKFTLIGFQRRRRGDENQLGQPASPEAASRTSDKGQFFRIAQRALGTR